MTESSPRRRRIRPSRRKLHHNSYDEFVKRVLWQPNEFQVLQWMANALRLKKSPQEDGGTPGIVTDS